MKLTFNLIEYPKGTIESVAMILKTLYIIYVSERYVYKTV